MPDSLPDDMGPLAQLMLAALAARGNQASLCPSEIARRWMPDGWRDAMPAVRQVAQALARQGQLDILQKGVVLPLGHPLRGPIRLRHRRMPPPLPGGS